MSKKAENKVNLKQLIEEKIESVISYPDLLNTAEWETKRNEILKRDRFYCTSCGLSETSLEHNQYISFDRNKYYIREVGEITIEADTPVNVDRAISLHVHHKYYILGRLPWDYADEALVTLCDSCHYELHEREYVEVYEERDGELIGLDYTSCRRCHGAGYFPEYSHVQGGVCFKCNGARYESYRGSLNGRWKIEHGHL